MIAPYGATTLVRHAFALDVQEFVEARRSSAEEGTSVPASLPPVGIFIYPLAVSATVLRL
jgi:hypothetical protein